ncbi:MAG: hypothetical protein K2Q01_11340 [Rickettsiales bacterium]|nr:hypothetical protein [Rickettsiales bacterium]
MQNTFSAYPLWQRLLLAALFLGFSAAYIPFVPDDAFISFRYADNWLRHGIWNWNPDNDRVEAYTSGAYTFLAVIPHALHIPPLLFFKAFGFALLAAMLLRVHRMATSPAVRFGLMLYVLANPYLYIHVYSCLETPLFILLCLELYWFLLTEKSDIRWFYAVLLLLPLTRPEGALLSLLAFAVMARRKRMRLPHPVFLAAVVALGAAYMHWRYRYFGYLLPNTAYAKALNVTDPAAWWEELKAVMHYWLILPFLAVVIKETRFRLIVCMAVFVYSVTYLHANLVMNYATRFPLQMFLPVVLAAALPLSKLGKIKQACAALLLLWHLFSCYDTYELNLMLTYGPNLEHSDVALGKTLAPYRDKHYSMLVSDSGASAYYSGWKSYDFLGLADVVIAHNGLSREYLNHTRPDLILYRAYGPTEAEAVTWGDWYLVAEYMQANPHYDYIAPLTFSDDYYYLIYLKNTLPDYQALKAAITETAEKSKTDAAKPQWLHALLP